VPGQGGQWYLMAATATTCNGAPCGSTTAAVDAVDAWGLSTGSAGLVIAVLDTGVRFDHPDLLRAGAGGRLLPGYDFVGADGGGTASNTFLTANDGNGWDPDPSDPGDWIDANDVAKPIFQSCTQEPSSWHGTRVAGIIGALTNNSLGVAGLDWSVWLEPVRVLGKCGGYDSDIIAAITWASGFAVAGVPANPYPARIINMSLGGTTVCSAEYQAAVNAATARGIVVVASAGNEGGPIDAPANCSGVIGVTGARHIGTKVGYGNVSGSILDPVTSTSVFASVALAAPGYATG
jgi:serine protease